MNKKHILILLTVVLVLITGCTSLKSGVKDFSAEWIGLERTFRVYDDNGSNRWQHVGSTMIAHETGLENVVDGYTDALNLTGDGSGITSVNSAINQFFSTTIGLERVVVIKTQTGMPIAVFEGDKVLIEDSELPQTTKLLIIRCT